MAVVEDGCRKPVPEVWVSPKFQALVDDIFHPGGRCRKAMLRVRVPQTPSTDLRHPCSKRKVPESDAGSVASPVGQRQATPGVCGRDCWSVPGAGRGHQRPPADRGDAVQSPVPAASSGLTIPFTGPQTAILVWLTSIFVCDELAQHICD